MTRREQRLALVGLGMMAPRRTRRAWRIFSERVVLPGVVIGFAVLRRADLAAAGGSGPDQPDPGAARVVDGSGKWACPGFFDAHLHIESTMVTPAGHARSVLPCGTTSAVIDPHEIGNVMGKEGVRPM